ncbi:MAG: hypothetical protein KF891_06915 [Rhizobacter sp.]|nr:hypothetical protein [Rhizobacter sp.]
MTTRLHLMAGALLAGVLLGACGGGGSDAPSTPDEGVPDSALMSSAGYTAWVRSLGPDDSSEPLSLARLVDVPSSETDEPVALE